MNRKYASKRGVPLATSKSHLLNAMCDNERIKTMGYAHCVNAAEPSIA
jgi:hypothetical protein